MDIKQLRVDALRRIIGDTTQRDFAEKHDLDASYLSQILTGHRKLGDKAAKNLEEKIGLRSNELVMPSTNNLVREEPESYGPSEADYAVIPQFTAKGDCGDGYLNDHVELKGGLAFRRDWIHRMHARPDNLYVIYAEGSSMEPYIVDGDIVLFDKSDLSPRTDNVYVIRRPSGGNSIKRLIQQLNGTWMIRSDNPDKAKYPDEYASPEALHDIPLLGRVIWRGGSIN